MKILMNDGQVVECPEDEVTHVVRHSAAHIMAQAIKRLYPEADFAYGPATDNGFYYDVDLGDKKIGEDDLPAIEDEMKKIVKENLKFSVFEKPRAEAIALMEERGEKYKVEHIGDLDADARITFYQQGDYIDMCVGPHVCYTKAVKAFKLTGVSGAYWKNDKDNKMLTRINGVAFATKPELEEHLRLIEEAKKRDHRKIGQEMDLFMMRDEAPGFPFFLPNGMILKNTLIDDEEYCIKPMNCPGGVLVYASKPHSYRELPIRAGEIGLVHRHELRGALHGLFRVRCFNQDDAHLFVRPDQLTDEIVGVVNLIDSVYQKFGFKYHVELSTRPEDSMGSDEDWARAEEGLKTALDQLGMAYEVNEGDGAFYGPKIDFHLEDSLGRTWQCGTVQLDFQMPINFDLEYVDADGTKKRPIMLHRVCFGSIERFIGILIEHFAGKFPTWLAPVQVKVLPVSEKSRDYAHTVTEALEAAGVRVVCDDRDEKIGYKIREARSTDRVPYMLIIGEKEAEAGNISVRDRSNETVQMETAEFVEKIREEIATRA